MKKSKVWALASLAISLSLALFLSGCGLFSFPKADKSFPFDAAVEDGYTDTRGEWLASQEKPSTIYRLMYEEAVADGSFSGTYFEFLQQLGLKEDDTPSINAALCSVVRIECYFPDTNGSAGAGVVWSVNRAAGDAYILTNYHVLYNAASRTPVSSDIFVWLYGEEVSARAMSAEYFGGTMEYDLAILYIKGETLVRDTLLNTHTNAEVIQNSSMKAAAFADSDSITLGEKVYAIGNPIGHGISVVSGVVSVDLEYVPVKTADGKKTVTLPEIRTDAPINHGNSGGGLFNSAGQVVGITNARSESEGVVAFGYAIPINFVLSVVHNLFDNGGTLVYARSGLELGVEDSLSVFNESTGKIYIEEKVVVSSVLASGVAYGVGMKEKDTVLSAKLVSASGGRTVAITRKHKLLALFFEVRQGDTLVLTISRAGERKEISLGFLSAANFTTVK